MGTPKWNDTVTGNNRPRADIKQNTSVNYFSIILDCTPDTFQTEKLTVIIWCVPCATSIVIYEHFLGFCSITDTTCKGLYEFDAYSRTFFIPCTVHSLNLVVKDAAKESSRSVDFLNLIQECACLLFGVKPSVECVTSAYTGSWH